MPPHSAVLVPITPPDCSRERMPTSSMRPSSLLWLGQGTRSGADSRRRACRLQQPHSRRSDHSVGYGDGPTADSGVS